MTIFSQWMTSPGGRLPLELELPTEPALPSIPEPETDAAPFVDRGMTIPDTYDVDVVRALVQDPFHLMVYWELRPESLRALAAIFPDATPDTFHPSMRLADVDEGFEAYVAIPLAGKYWFGTMPDRSYRIDLGVRSNDYGFVPIVRSNVVHTPRGTVAAEVDDDPRFAVDTPRFVRLLAATGFATDRVLAEVARADAAAESGEEAPRSEVPVPPFLATAFARLPQPVRQAAATVAKGGSISQDLLESLPDRLRAALLGLRQEDEVVTAAFMHLLPQLLRQALEGAFAEGGAFLVDGTHPFHLPPRFAIGSSDEIRRPKVDWEWMPSMTESLATRAPALEPDPLDPTIP